MRRQAQEEAKIKAEAFSRLNKMADELRTSVSADLSAKHLGDEGCAYIIDALAFNERCERTESVCSILVQTTGGSLLTLSPSMRGAVRQCHWWNINLGAQSVLACLVCALPTSSTRLPSLRGVTKLRTSVYSVLVEITGGTSSTLLPSMRGAAR